MNTVDEDADIQTLVLSLENDGPGKDIGLIIIFDLPSGKSASDTELFIMNLFIVAKRQ